MGNQEERELANAGAVNALIVDAFSRTKVGSGAFEKFFAVVRDELDKITVRLWPLRSVASLCLSNFPSRQRF